MRVKRVEKLVFTDKEVELLNDARSLLHDIYEETSAGEISNTAHDAVISIDFLLDDEYSMFESEDI